MGRAVGASIKRWLAGPPGTVCADAELATIELARRASVRSKRRMRKEGMPSQALALTVQRQSPSRSPASASDTTGGTNELTSPPQWWISRTMEEATKM
ncbi:MAG: hypothetical protein Rubg2KO_00140 [Rubricoccaceae bacterium]